MKSLILATPLLMGLSSCCALCDWWCGPDDSQWISISFATPDHSVSTFREAARRGDSLVAYRCFEPGMLERNGIAGAFEFAVLWDQLDDEIPLHMIGNSEVSGPDSPGSHGVVEYSLHRLGRTLDLRLVRQDVIELNYYDDDLGLVEGGEYPRSLRGILNVAPTDSGDTRVGIEFETLLDLDSLPANRVQRAGIAREWKIRALRARAGDEVLFSIGR